MAYIAMDCSESRWNGERKLLITVLEYETDDPILLTGVENFQETVNFISYLKKLKNLGFADMYTEKESLVNFTIEDLHAIEDIMNLKLY